MTTDPTQPTESAGEFHRRHAEFRRAAAPIVSGTATAEQIAEYRRVSAEWAAFLDASPHKHTGEEPQGAA